MQSLLSRASRATCFILLCTAACSSDDTSTPLGVTEAPAGTGASSTAGKSGSTGTAGTAAKGGGTAGTSGLTGSVAGRGVVAVAGRSGSAGTAGIPSTSDEDGGVPSAAGTGAGGSRAGGAGSAGRASAGTGGTGTAGTGTAGSSGAAGSGAAATFSDVYAVFMTGCMGASCHVGASRAGDGLVMTDKMTAYTNLVDANSVSCPGLKRVVAGDAANSELLHTLDHTAAGTCANTPRMPDNKPMLSAADIALVTSWITAGALNN
jgi:hypothetical protein